MCWHHFQMRLNRTIEDVVCFAKKIPGFAELDQDDQISLIKGGCFEVRFCLPDILNVLKKETVLVYVDIIRKIILHIEK